MRIISGTARGRRLRTPPSEAIRPTTDRVREALFSILGAIHGAVVVDAFAGSGALGLEALSRGAGRCYFFDTSRQAIEVIDENIELVGVKDRAVVQRCSFVNGLKTTVEGTPDLWFFDPPYGTQFAEKGLQAMRMTPDKVTSGTLVVWESGRDEEIPQVEGFKVVDTRIYGSIRLAFFRFGEKEGE